MAKNILKYEGESDYRYLVDTDMTWLTMNIIQAYTLRWLLEVFFEDWKWAREAKQLEEEGSSRGLILSLLLDHCLLLHPEQTVRIENELPAYTVGSLQRKSQMDMLLEFIKTVLEHQNPADKLKGSVCKKFKNLKIEYYQPKMDVLHSVDAWKLKRRYFIKLHFVSGKKYGQYEMESFNLNVLGVPPFMLNHFILHALLAASMFIRGESGSIRQTMNASHSLGSIWGSYLSWKSQRIHS